MQRMILTCVAVSMLLCFSSTESLGQAITGAIVGTVTDSSKSVIAGANTTVQNLDTGVANRTATGAEGFYTVLNLPPGHYRVTVEYPGFKKSVVPDVIVRVEETTRVDVSLSAGAVTETVNVSANPPMVQSTTSDLGSVIESKQINNLPLNGRLFEQLVTLTPGAAPAGWGDQDENPAGSGAQSPVYATVNGMPFSGNLFLVDGIHNVEPQNAYISIAIPLAAISEFKLETSNPSAQFGTFGGAVINLTTKPGTNSFHGSAFDYIRNDAFNAKDHFALKKFPYKANQFGAALGGPILKEKMFFFLDYQELIQHGGQTYTLTVPSAAERTGDLSVLNNAGKGPITNAAACQTIVAAQGISGAVPCTASPAVTVAGTYDTIPAADLSPIAQNLLSPSVVPLPTPGVAGGCNGTCNNFITNTVNSQTTPQFDARIDYVLSDKNRFFVRDSYLYRKFASPAPGTPFMKGSNPNAKNLSDNAVIAWDHVFSGTKTNQLRIGFNRYATSDWVDSFGINENNILGIPNGNLLGLPITSGIAQFNVSGGNFLSPTGDPGPIPNGLGRLANIFEEADNYSWIHGRHTFQFGGDVQRVQTSVRNPQNDPRGQFFFGGGYTGNGLADLLIGGANGVNRDLFPSTPATRVTFLGFFAQDDLRVREEFTLNLGLRWDVYTAPVDVHNAQSNFLISGPNAGLIQIASSANRGPNLNTYLRNWQPRIGFAYSPDGGKTALRAAFGISFFPDNFGADGGTLERNYPELLQQTNAATSNTNPAAALLLSNGLPGLTAGAYSALVVPPLTPGGFVNPPKGFGVFEVARNFQQDEARAWNLSIQRQLTRDMFVEAAYVGTNGYHLFHDYQLNQCDPPEIVAINPYPACLPFYAVNPNITQVHFRNSSGESRYNAGQFELVKRTGVGLTLIASYTWSKMLDNISNLLDPYVTTLTQVNGGFKTANYPQLFTASYNYDLPFGHGRRWLGGTTGVLDALVGQWAINGITTYRSGGALWITANKSLLPPQADVEPANFNCAGQSMNNPHKIAEWFQTSCFSSPTPNTFGNAGIADVFGPGLTSWDLSISKAIRLTEGKRLKLEASFFNLFNNINLSNPDTNVQDKSFGVISGDNQVPREMQLGLVFSF